MMEVTRNLEWLGRIQRGVVALYVINEEMAP